MATLTEGERQLLERLAAEGKATRLLVDDLQLAKSLAAEGLLFLIGQDDPYAIITPIGKPGKEAETRQTAAWLPRVVLVLVARRQSAPS